MYRAGLYLSTADSHTVSMTPVLSSGRASSSSSATARCAGLEPTRPKSNGYEFPPSTSWCYVQYLGLFIVGGRFIVRGSPGGALDDEQVEFRVLRAVRRAARWIVVTKCPTEVLSTQASCVSVARRCLDDGALAGRHSSAVETVRTFPTDEKVRSP